MDILIVDPELRAATLKAPKLNLENPVMLTLVGLGSAIMPGKRVDGVERRIVRERGLKLRVYVPDILRAPACCGSTAAVSSWALRPWTTCSAGRPRGRPG